MTVALIANDTGVRPNQTGWGLGTDGQPWNMALGTGADVTMNSQYMTILGWDTFHMTYGGSTAQFGILPQVYNFDQYVWVTTNANDVQAGFLFDYIDPNNCVYVACLHNEVVMYKYIAGTPTLIGVTTSVTFTPGTLYRLHLNVTGNVATFYFWASGGSQGAAALTVTDNIFLAGGGNGLFTHTGAYTDQAQYSYYTNTATLITDYYVDPVSGNDSHSGLTPALAWATLTHASAKVNPGCTIHCAAGTITNSANTTKACGTPTQRVVYQGAAGYASKLVSTGGNATTAWENDGAYNDIVGFDVTGNGQIGINLGGTGVSVKYCKIHDIPCTSSVGGGGVVAGYTTATALTDADIIGNLIYNIGYNDTESGFRWQRRFLEPRPGLLLRFCGSRKIVCTPFRMKRGFHEFFG